jgi:predicted Rossmann fold nucleotide-binding protein DprA/Smf involved in DNA uptake
LARGIDEIAHRTCLEQGAPTIAVLGCGLDQIEQSARRHLARMVAEHGAVVSEFPFGGPVVKGNFPRRNRIISGLSQAVVVVEAGETSGALITARNGLEQGREVLTCPGPVGWTTFEGNHRLLREGAALCARPQDLLDQLGWHTTSPDAASDGFLDWLAGLASGFKWMMLVTISKPDSSSATAVQCAVFGCAHVRDQCPGFRMRRHSANTGLSSSQNASPRVTSQTADIRRPAGGSAKIATAEAVGSFLSSLALSPVTSAYLT